MLSIIIPARTEKFLNRTIQEVLDKATGEIEVIPVLDGYPDDYKYEKIIDKRVKYISLPVPDNYERHKRQAVNAGVSISRGKYVMWLDAHCAISKGFDEVLAKDCEDDWIVVPRRNWLDTKKWDRKYQDRVPIDYQYFMWSHLKKGKLSTFKWDRKSIERKDIMIDDIFTSQGSLFFMTRKHFDRMGFMQLDGYSGWGQEEEEVCLTTLLNGGRAVVNKNVWYAHMGKNQMPNRMYKYTNVQSCYEWSFNYWVHEQKEFFIDLINKNMPVPNYPNNWTEELYGNN